MARLKSLKGNVVSIVSGILIGSLFLGTAWAVTSSSFTYPKTQTGYLSLAPGDFAPDSIRDPNLDFFNGWSSANLSNDDSSRCFNAGVNLPNGAKIKSIRFWYISGPSEDFYGVLDRVSLAGGNSTTLAFVQPADDTDVRTSAVAPVTEKQTVSNAKFAYFVGVCPFGDTSFEGAQLKYTYTSAGD